VNTGTAGALVRMCCKALDLDQKALFALPAHLRARALRGPSVQVELSDSHSKQLAPLVSVSKFQNAPVLSANQLAQARVARVK